MDSLYLDRNLILDSTSTLEEAGVVLLGVPFDCTSSYRPGSRFAPLEIRRQLIELELESGGKSVYGQGLFDLGNIEVVYGNAAKTLERTESVLKDALSLNSGALFVVLGGEHLVSYPAVKALKGEVDVFVQLDAHADLRGQYLGESLSHACVGRRVAELGLDVVQYGVRSCCSEEQEYIRCNDVVSLSPTDGVSKLFEQVEGRRVYLSVDLDVLDPCVTLGVGNPEPGGMSFKSLSSLICDVKRRCQVAGFDVTEASPVYDESAGLYAARLVADILLS